MFPRERARCRDGFLFAFLDVERAGHLSDAELATRRRQVFTCKTVLCHPFITLDVAFTVYFLKARGWHHKPLHVSSGMVKLCNHTVDAIHQLLNVVNDERKRRLGAVATEGT